MTANADGDSLRRSKRAKKSRKRPANLGTRFEDDDDTTSNDELRLLVNQLQREELEQLVMRLVNRSVDCGDLIEMETAQGKLQKPVKSFQVGSVGQGNLASLGTLGKLPAECKFLPFVFFLVAVRGGEDCRDGTGR